MLPDNTLYRFYVDNLRAVEASINYTSQSDCGCVIVAKDDRLIGMITDRDIAIRCIAEEHDPASIEIEKIMTRDILYCRDTDDTDDVVRNMPAGRLLSAARFWAA